MVAAILPEREASAAMYMRTIGGYTMLLLTTGIALALHQSVDGLTCQFRQTSKDDDILFSQKPR